MPVIKPCALDAAATMPSKTYPTWEIEEYASIRLMLVCVIAAKLPIVSDATATPATSISQSRRTGQKTVSSNRSSSAKLAVFDATLIYAVIGVGAPSYTSGANG